MKRHCLLRYICTVLLLCLSSVVGAEVRLPGFFNDHMVVQQNTGIKVWGWADPGEEIVVTLDGNAASTAAGADGRWKVELNPRKASADPITLKARSKNNTLEIKDVLVGEVWLCSGQSNMEWSVRASANAEQEIANANYSLIRHVKMGRKPSNVPLNDIDAQWQVCSPETVANFTACGYFMARHLHKELNVPIGLINSSWGGTRVEPWTPPNGFKQVEKLQDIYTSVVGRTPGTDAFKATLQKHIAATEKWLQQTKAADPSQTVAASPSFPDALTPFKSHQDPTMLYNGMIHPLVGYPIKGAIWYQGESNHDEGMMYFEKKKALINGWRDLWGQGDFPFYYVQIAPFRYRSESDVLAQFWEAQAAIQKVKNTGMVVINDIATVGNIHPPNKQDVGLRLANLALKHDYGRDDVVAHSPQFDSLKIADDHLELTFTSTGGGLKTRDGKPATHFEIIGAGSGGFQPAVAAINGNVVMLSSDKVAKPVAFRFAWDKLAEPNLSGGTGLPVGAVRAGKVPEFFDNVPGRDDYELVYDINLDALGESVKYDVDNSSTIKSFDRIGYLVELQSGNGKQNVFVSMDAFTSDVKKIGIPTFDSKGSFQQNVESMDVHSDVAGVTSGTSISTGNIEFWPNNYAPGNAAKIPGASGTRFDFGDVKGPPVNGYGSMQVHNHAAKQTIFAINHWNQGGANADIGIGNGTGQNKDWTFSKNGGSYSSKRLRVFVRSK